MALLRRCITALVLLMPHITDAFSGGGFRRAPPVKLSEEMGISPTVSVLVSLTNTIRNAAAGDADKNNDNDPPYFDPVGFATDDNFAYLREAELKHGRVSMLATVGMILSNGGDQAILALARQEKLVPKLLPKESAIHDLTPFNVVKVFVICAILETQVFVQRDPQDMPGDYGLGYFGRRDKARHERSLMSELENGRLAMLAFVIQVGWELVTGKSCWGLLYELISHSSATFSVA